MSELTQAIERLCVGVVALCVKHDRLMADLPELMRMTAMSQADILRAEIKLLRRDVEVLRQDIRRAADMES